MCAAASASKSPECNRSCSPSEQDVLQQQLLAIGNWHLAWRPIRLGQVLIANCSFILTGFPVPYRRDRGEESGFENPGLHEAGAAERRAPQAQRDCGVDSRRRLV